MKSDTVSLNSVNDLFSQTAAPIAEDHVYAVELITSQRQLANKWYSAFKRIFTDKDDRTPLYKLTNRFRNGDNFFVLVGLDGAAKGIALPLILISTNVSDRTDNSRSSHNVTDSSPVKILRLMPMYVPWVGVQRDVQNNGLGTRFHEAVTEIMKSKYAVTHTLLDIEDPTRLHQSGYPADELSNAIKFAERRINYWKRQGFMIINDERLKYTRPLLKNSQEIQAYDHMAIRFEDSDLKAKYLSKDGTKIDIEFVRQSYLDMTRIQYGDFSEEELRAKFPAVQHYLTELDSVMKRDRWLSLDNAAVIPKITPDNFVEFKLTAANQYYSYDSNLVRKLDDILHKDMT